jgi:hypothetical protein
VFGGTGVAVLLACIAGVSPARLEAQDAAPYRARVDSIARLWQDARESAERADNARRAAVEIDTLVRGGLVVTTTPEFRDLVEAATQLAWEQLGTTLREDTSLMRSRTFYVVSTESEDPIPERMQREAEIIAYAEMSTSADVAMRIAQRLERAAVADLDQETRLFLGDQVPLRPHSERQWRWVYVELATAPWHLTRACYLGDLERCAEALDLPPADDPPTAWYDAAERRGLITAYGSWFMKDPRRTQCVDAGSDEVCLELLRSGKAGGLSPPLSIRARRSLTATALELGGEGAYGRLLDDAVTGPLQRLTAAAAVPFDSLLSAWHARVITARPRPTTITRLAGWTAFFWIIAFAAIGARSTRWRRG